ncbi:hypothetical protein Hanom_Chr09g00834451 [Helianthus anomalus]
MAGSRWPCVNSCPPTQAPNPSPTIPHGHGFFSHSTCQPMPNPSPTIPHGLRTWGMVGRGFGAWVNT